MAERIWTPEQVAEILARRIKGEKPVAIAISYPGRTAAQVGRVLRQQRERGKNCKGDATEDLMRGLGHGGRPPQEVLFDRDRRLNATLTLSMIFFGDPTMPRWHSNATPRRTGISGAP
jgi:hypothetical protein